ncbi:MULTISPECIES: NUDIX hydrolase [Priestia]|uniref:NUDIX hydrolase n=1 Tax=Priestia TaxID=2800373 RepID=UPI002A6AA300|nr:NUDIX domain-containing protein [Priestia megaterium]MDY0942318.1 NUDIX domain-containing protein [Priestia megaterium]
MNTCCGFAIICLNDKDELLMVSQEKPNMPKRWSVPSGAIEGHERLEDCCVREVWNQTGYQVEIVKKIHENRSTTYNVDVHMTYFEVKILAGEKKVQIVDSYFWQPISKINHLNLLFEDEREVVLNYIKKKKQFI